MSHNLIFQQKHNFSRVTSKIVPRRQFWSHNFSYNILNLLPFHLTPMMSSFRSFEIKFCICHFYSWNFSLFTFSLTPKRRRRVTRFGGFEKPKRKSQFWLFNWFGLLFGLVTLWIIQNKYETFQKSAEFLVFETRKLCHLQKWMFLHPMTLALIVDVNKKNIVHGRR